MSLLSPDKTIADRTLLLAGTPAGTVFQGIDTATRARGAVSWLFGGWDTPLPANVVETYIRDARAGGAYLKPGDRVVLQIDRLGFIENEIGP